MPWSPVTKFPAVMMNIARKGHILEISLKELELAVIEEIGIVREPTIKRTIETMEKMGLVKLSRNGVFSIVAGRKAEKKPKSIGMNEAAAVDNIIAAAAKG